MKNIILFSLFSLATTSCFAGIPLGEIFEGSPRVDALIAQDAEKLMQQNQDQQKKDDALIRQILDGKANLVDQLSTAGKQKLSTLLAEEQKRRDKSSCTIS